MSNPPSTEGFGTRQFVHLLVLALREYLRHKDQIDPDMPTGGTAAIEVLVGLIADLLALNPPGPE
jgi:hypothetical protein